MGGMLTRHATTRVNKTTLITGALPSGVEYQLSAINIPQSFKDLKSPAPVDIAVVATYASGL